MRDKGTPRRSLSGAELMKIHVPALSVFNKNPFDFLNNSVCRCLLLAYSSASGASNLSTCRLSCSLHLCTVLTAHLLVACDCTGSSGTGNTLLFATCVSLTCMTNYL